MTVAERAKERRKSHTTKNVDGIVMWCDVMCLCCCCCASVFFVIEKNPRKKRNVLFAKMQNMYTRFLFWFITIPVYSCSTFRHQAISHHKWSIIYIYTYIFAVDKVKAAQLKEEKKVSPNRSRRYHSISGSRLVVHTTITKRKASSTFNDIRNDNKKRWINFFRLLSSNEHNQNYLFTNSWVFNEILYSYWLFVFAFNFFLLSAFYPILTLSCIHF